MENNKDNLNFPGLSYYDSSIKEWVKQQIKKSSVDFSKIIGSENDPDTYNTINGIKNYIKNSLTWEQLN